MNPIGAKDLIAALNKVDTQQEETLPREEPCKVVNEVKLNFRLTSAELSISHLQDIVHEVLSRTNLTDEEMHNLAIALEEAVLNAHEHGNLELQSEWKDEFSDDGITTKFEVVKDTRLQLPKYAARRMKMSLLVSSGQVQFSVEDEGSGFACTNIPSEAPGTAYGMGLMIINNLMDEVRFNPKGNRITFVKRIAAIS